jgi:hypothetical protein
VIKDQIVTDASSPELKDVKTIAGKMAAMTIVNGARLNTSQDVDAAESRNVFNYKAALGRNGDRRMRLYSADGKIAEGDDSQTRRPGHKNYKTHVTTESVVTAAFGDNAHKERRMGGLGNKYMNRFIDRDARGDEIAAAMG